MSHYDSTALLLVSGDEANSVNCLRGVQDVENVYKHTG